MDFTSLDRILNYYKNINNFYTECSKKYPKTIDEFEGNYAHQLEEWHLFLIHTAIFVENTFTIKQKQGIVKEYYSSDVVEGILILGEEKPLELSVTLSLACALLCLDKIIVENTVNNVVTYLTSHSITHSAIEKKLSDIVSLNRYIKEKNNFLVFWKGRIDALKTNELLYQIATSNEMGLISELLSNPYLQNIIVSSLEVNKLTNKEMLNVYENQIGSIGLLGKFVTKETKNKVQKFIDNRNIPKKDMEDVDDR